MSHTISFVRPYKSITILDSVALPNISIITGSNGSGKSHLLEAISLGCISSSEAPDFRKEISRFDWNTIVPKDNGSYSIATRTAKIDDAILRFKDAKNSILSIIQSNLESNPHLGRNLVETLYDLEYISNPENAGYLTGDQEQTTASNVQSWMRQYGPQFSNSIGTDSQELRQKVRDIWAKDYRLLMFGKSDDVRGQLISAEESILSLFTQAFAKIFVEYRQRWQENLLSRFTQDSSLSDDEFTAHNQMPPWDFVNDILEESRLPFRINFPSENKFMEAYEPKLTRLNNGAEMHFSDLSSGEKVLMSFALCVYNTTGRNCVTFPKILLLDEVDAPLHPEMVGVMLGVLNRFLVKKHSIKVVLTTHKPTTVALAPEGSIYQMISEGPKLVPISREKAVSILTVGVPTMAFTTDMRLQVFTEARVDAAVLGRMYQLFKSQLAGNRSIAFIESGRRTSSGDMDSGRFRVNDLVTKLRGSGASTILGVVDWDGKDNNVSWVYEICRGKRHSLENLFLDPVIVITLLVKDYVVLARRRGIISDSETYADLLRWNVERWQAAVDTFGNLIFDSANSKVSVKYCNGMNLLIVERFLVMRGHDLVEHMNCRLNGAFNRHAGDKLINHISVTIIPDIKNIVPKDIPKTLEDLLELGE